MVAFKEKWKIWIDTGGTFTDCMAKSPEGKYKTFKLLSSGSLIATAISRKDVNTLEFEHNWPFTKNILNNYNVKVLARGTHLGSITSVDFKHNTLTVDNNLSKTLRFPFEFSISSIEEVPTTAARLITQTSLTGSLPPFDMRIATTKGTNALLEKKGSKVTLIITKGHKDLLEIGYQQRPDLFSLNVTKASQLYANVIEVNERIGARGEILVSLTKNEMEKVVNKLKKTKPEAVAVCFLHSYTNPLHEKRLKKYLLQAGITRISTSSEIIPSIKIIPRARACVVNAYLDFIINKYLDNIGFKTKKNTLNVMTSAGGLVNKNDFLPKDSLLSGPAAGIVGAAASASLSGSKSIITFDMGGTSTDVARFDSDFSYKKVLKVGGTEIATDALEIESIAAGGGSVCATDGHRLFIGPQSAGADPGPACYGQGGPLTITDVNLLLGRTDVAKFGIPISLEKAKKACVEIISKLEKSESISLEDLCDGFLQIANEKMAEAISKISTLRGYDPENYDLLGFGGAGGQHVCKIAEILGMKKIIVPASAGVLSAFGLGKAVPERIISRQILKPLKQIVKDISSLIHKMGQKASEELIRKGFAENQIEVRKKVLLLRFQGQESTLEVEYRGLNTISRDFKRQYKEVYGHWLKDREIEVESIRVIVSGLKNENKSKNLKVKRYRPVANNKLKTYTDGAWKEIDSFEFSEIRAGAEIKGPVIVAGTQNTIFVDKGWVLGIDVNKNAILTSENKYKKVETSINAANLELFQNRLMSIAVDMGALMERSSISVNIKERLDFSCGILDNKGKLIVNAPHIPVHLGGLGVCVREIIKNINLEKGDVIITNHPGYGGSHLPDITLIAPVYYKNKLIAYVANRAHHAEIGGIRPGSMPINATRLPQEGVIIKPTYLIKKGIAQWENVLCLFKNQPFPSRRIEENFADLNGALASLQEGVKKITYLAQTFGVDMLQGSMENILSYSQNLVERAIHGIQKNLKATEYLDDGTKIKVQITPKTNSLLIDFTGTAKSHNGNLNATPAIVHSAVIYVLRLLVNENLPLNEGLLNSVKIKLPRCFLNPTFQLDDLNNPAVVGGNTETSQRLVDLLLKAFGLAACSQGTMNNLLFGNENFSYYETICGGTGAIKGHDGTDAVQQHMTNTRITDPEILELNYPVLLEKFEIRKKSGGKGIWNGGNGVRREIKFLEPVELTLLSQHRKISPYGMNGGKDGAKGNQYLKINGLKKLLKGADESELNQGDSIVIETPGGGGWGKSII